MFYVIHYLTSSERAALLRRCFDEWLEPDGCVVVLACMRSDGREVGFREIYRRLAPDRQFADDEDIESEFLALGCRVEQAYDVTTRQDFTGDDDDFLMFFHFAAGGNCATADLAQIRRVIDDVVPDGFVEMRQRLMIVKKIQS